MRRLAACLLIGLWGAIALGQAPPADPPGQGDSPTAQPAKRRKSANMPRVSAVTLLHARLPHIEFDEVRLDDALAQLAEISGTTIVVRWRKLEASGVQRDQPISITVRGLRLGQVLWLIMSEAGGPDAALAYRADRDTIMISTVEDFGQQMVVRTYDVRDLIASRPRSALLWVGRERQIPIGNTVSVAAGAVAVQPVIGRIGSGVFFGGEGDLRRSDLGGEEGQTPAQHLQRLINTITATIEPDSWAVNGGRGTISSYRGTLVVRNSPLVHQQIGGYLSEQRSP